MTVAPPFVNSWSKSVTTPAALAIVLFLRGGSHKDRLQARCPFFHMFYRSITGKYTESQLGYAHHMCTIWRRSGFDILIRRFAGPLSLMTMLVKPRVSLETDDMLPVWFW
ncbi:uncharacterized protein BT62DRAFT_1009769 [Guyanagaster necrorhizus]|uniref:Uncharacterized protein n=1 Tax=Guyanagaster necrorhizus TaxID=856835 RepID=A0A9P8APP6_9AGAR|nr:uncharacterized protein BT62DRAFT_1009769 [Guyanagaster necrorhizus MCA 3950]KAG7443165.1 hypothetical protein BT62DRAFT_1009769 [Guyanagaster necrorhizus MCA 3950]